MLAEQACQVKVAHRLTLESEPASDQHWLWYGIDLDTLGEECS